jgi:hypothetical protein
VKQLLLLGALGVVLAVATGLAVHLLTRETIALPVVKLDTDDGLAPAAARAETTTARARTTTARQTTVTTRGATTAGASTTRAATGGAKTLPETDEDGNEQTTDNSGPGSDNSGRGRGRGRGRGGDGADD